MIAGEPDMSPPAFGQGEARDPVMPCISVLCSSKKRARVMSILSACPVRACAAVVRPLFCYVAPFCDCFSSIRLSIISCR